MKLFCLGELEGEGDGWSHPPVPDRGSKFGAVVNRVIVEHRELMLMIHISTGKAKGAALTSLMTRLLAMVCALGIPQVQLPPSRSLRDLRLKLGLTARRNEE